MSQTSNLLQSNRTKAVLFSGFQGKVKMAPLDLRLCLWFDSNEDRRLTKRQSSGVIQGWPGVKIVTLQKLELLSYRTCQARVDKIPSLIITSPDLLQTTWWLLQFDSKIFSYFIKEVKSIEIIRPLYIGQALDTASEVLCHVTGFNCIDARLLQSVAKVGKIVIAWKQTNKQTKSLISTKGFKPGQLFAGKMTFIPKIAPVEWLSKTEGAFHLVKNSGSFGSDVNGKLSFFCLPNKKIFRRKSKQKC